MATPHSRLLHVLFTFYSRGKREEAGNDSEINNVCVPNERRVVLVLEKILMNKNVRKCEEKKVRHIGTRTYTTLPNTDSRDGRLRPLSYARGAISGSKNIYITLHTELDCSGL